jgi:hypothetical protein
VIAALLVIAPPIEKVDPFQSEIKDPTDLTIRLREWIRHFFKHYKALEAGKWVKVNGWGDSDGIDQAGQQGPNETRESGKRPENTPPAIHPTASNGRKPLPDGAFWS